MRGAWGFAACGALLSGSALTKICSSQDRDRVMRARCSGDTAAVAGNVCAALGGVIRSARREGAITSPSPASPEALPDPLAETSAAPLGPEAFVRRALGALEADFREM